MRRVRWWTALPSPHRVFGLVHLSGEPTHSNQPSAWAIQPSASSRANRMAMSTRGNAAANANESTVRGSSPMSRYTSMSSGRGRGLSSLAPGADREWSSWSSASTSPASSTGAAPSRSSWLVPALARLRRARKSQVRRKQQEQDAGNHDGERDSAGERGQIIPVQTKHRQEKHCEQGCVNPRHPRDQRNAEFPVEVEPECFLPPARQPIAAAVDHGEQHCQCSHVAHSGSHIFGIGT